MKLHFEEENLSKKRECSSLTSNLEGTALNCVMAKRANERDRGTALARYSNPAESLRLWSTRASGYVEIREEASKG